MQGFEPVVHPDHYGASGGGGYGQRSGGRIRTNMFFPREWLLREFHLKNSCDFKLVLDPVTVVTTNPYHEMFIVLNAAPDPRAGALQSSFPAQSGALSTDQVALCMSIDDKLNAGQSSSQDFTQDYEFQFGLGSPHIAFSNGITSALRSLPTPRPDLTPEDVVWRAETQSCGGCHQLSNGVSFGGKLNPTWPFSRSFVHSDESRFLSQALWCVFLPARKTVLDGFAASPSVECPPATKEPALVKPLVVLSSEVARQVVLPEVDPSALSVAGKLVGPN